MLQEFFDFPAIQALLESGFQKDGNGVYGRLNGFDVGVYGLLAPGNNIYYTYLDVVMPNRISFSTRFGETYRPEQIDARGLKWVRQCVPRIDGETLARSFARLQEIAITEKLEVPPSRPPGIILTHTR